MRRDGLFPDYTAGKRKLIFSRQKQRQYKQILVLGGCSLLKDFSFSFSLFFWFFEIGFFLIA